MISNKILDWIFAPVGYKNTTSSPHVIYGSGCYAHGIKFDLPKPETQLTWSSVLEVLQEEFPNILTNKEIAKSLNAKPDRTAALTLIMSEAGEIERFISKRGIRIAFYRYVGDA